MTSRPALLLLALALATSAACAQPAPTLDADPELALRYADTITPSDLAAHLYVFASDYFEGRETSTRGQKLAATYLAGQYRKLGLEPKGTAVTTDPLSPTAYFQPFDLTEAYVARAELSVMRAGEPVATSLFTPDQQDGLAYLRSGGDGATTGGVVFAGYGIGERRIRRPRRPPRRGHLPRRKVGPPARRRAALGRRPQPPHRRRRAGRFVVVPQSHRAPPSRPRRARRPPHRQRHEPAAAEERRRTGHGVRPRARLALPRRVGAQQPPAVRSDVQRLVGPRERDPRLVGPYRRGVAARHRRRAKTCRVRRGRRDGGGRRRASDADGRERERGRVHRGLRSGAQR